MKLWLVSQRTNNNYDTYDSMVVTANTEAEACNLDPDGGVWPSWKCNRWSSWCATPDEATAECIGETDRQGGEVILASFNAG
jgi:hypothetical protein